MVDVNKNIKDYELNRIDLVEYLDNKITDLYRTCNQPKDDIADGLAKYLIKYYPKLNVGMIGEAFRRGFEGEFDKNRKIDFRIIIQWIVNINKERKQGIQRSDEGNYTTANQRIHDLVFMAVEKKNEDPLWFSEHCPALDGLITGKLKIGKNVK